MRPEEFVSFLRDNSLLNQNNDAQEDAHELFKFIVEGPQLQEAIEAHPYAVDDASAMKDLFGYKSTSVVEWLVMMC